MLLPEREPLLPVPVRYCSKCQSRMTTWEEPNLLGGDAVRRASCPNCGHAERW